MDESDDDIFTVNLKNVLHDNELHSATRLLAASLMSEPYMTVRQWMAGLSTNDLDELQSYADEDGKLGNLVLISEMLATAEGLDSGDSNVIHERVSALVGFLVIESLDRKGLVKAVRENMSFGPEYSEKTIVMRLD